MYMERKQAITKRTKIHHRIKNMDELKTWNNAVGMISVQVNTSRDEIKHSQMIQLTL